MFDIPILCLKMLPSGGNILSMSTAQILFSALQGLNIKQQKRVAELSGVPWRTLYKIKRGFTADPKSSTVDRLLAVLRSTANLSQPAPKLCGQSHITESVNVPCSPSSLITE